MKDKLIFINDAGVYFVLLIIYLVIFHFIMLRLGPRPLLWKKVDYLWLGLAALSIIGISEKYRINELTNIQGYFKQNLSRDLESAMWWARTSKSMHKTYEDIEYNKKRVTSSKLFHRSFLFYDNTVRILNLDNSTKVWHGIRQSQALFLAGINNENIKDVDFILADMRKFDELARNVIVSYEDYDWIQNQLKPSALENIYYYMAPGLLSLALAIRITKVTASIKGYTTG